MVAVASHGRLEVVGLGNLFSVSWAGVSSCAAVGGFACQLLPSASSL